MQFPTFRTAESPLETTLPMNPSDGKCLINQSDEINSSCIINNVAGRFSLHLKGDSTISHASDAKCLPVLLISAAPYGHISSVDTYMSLQYICFHCHMGNTAMVKLSQQL